MKPPRARVPALRRGKADTGVRAVRPIRPDTVAAPARHLQPGDLRAATHLARQATAGLVDLVEAVHARIARLPLSGAPSAQADRTRGITGLVYQTVRGVSQVVGGSVEALLGWLEPAVMDTGSTLVTPEREALIAALNGVLGDHLALTGNALATPMALRVGGRPLVLERSALADWLADAEAGGREVPRPDAGSRVLVLLHGLCMNDLQWQRAGHDHGAFLAREAGWTAIYLHYNSGLPIAQNGVLLAALLGRLTAAWPQPITRLALLGHSMGGLVARSAIHAAQQAGLPWRSLLSDLVCLGSPHHGAPLERAGRGVDLLLQATPYSAPFARLARLRSAGITDLRHGRLVVDDGATAATRRPVPLPEGVNCCTVAARLGDDAGSLKQRMAGRLVGDGLVPLASALGRHADPAYDLGFAQDRQYVVPGTGHLDLLSSAAVAARLQRWLG